MISNTDKSIELTLCHAPYDGIKPAIFIQLGRKGPQVSGVMPLFCVLGSYSEQNQIKRQSPCSTSSMLLRASRGLCWSTRSVPQLP